MLSGGVVTSAAVLSGDGLACVAVLAGDAVTRVLVLVGNAVTRVAVPPRHLRAFAGFPVGAGVLAGPSPAVVGEEGPETRRDTDG